MVQIPSAEDHLAFVLTCLQTALDSGGKVDYEIAAKAHGLAHRTAYLRLWNLKKKAGIGGGAKSAGQDDDEAAGHTETPAKKRGRPHGPSKGRKTKKQKMEEEAALAKAEEGDENEDAGEEESVEGGEAFVKGKAKDMNDEVEE